MSIEPTDIIEVLLVEDDPGDVLLIEEAFEFNKVRNHLNVVSDGVEALEYLRQEGRHADAERPGLILLDLNLTAARCSPRSRRTRACARSPSWC